jgi:4-coumarate--CoA ligase
LLKIKRLTIESPVPQRVTVWDWLFDSLYSPLERYEEHELKGYQDAITKERVNWKQVKEYSTYISTALVKKYGLKEGQTVSLFSQNSIWYPVVMLGALRAGMFVRIE